MLGVGLIFGFALGALVAGILSWLHLDRLAVPKGKLLDLVRATAAHAGREAALESLPERQTVRLKLPLEERPTLVSGEVIRRSTPAPEE